MGGGLGGDRIVRKLVKEFLGIRSSRINSVTRASLRVNSTMEGEGAEGAEGLWTRMNVSFLYIAENFVSTIL